MTSFDPQWIDHIYRMWLENPAALSSEWQAFFSGFNLAAGTPETVAEAAASANHALKQSGVQSLIYRYRDIGHYLACTDPLHACPVSHPLLDLPAFGLDESDLDTTFSTRRFMKETASLREIVAVMRDTYCRSIGVEYMHIQNPAERQWLQDRIEPSRNRTPFTSADKLRILQKLQEAFYFEDFLHRKFPGQKRFSLEGGESLIALLDAVVVRAAESGFSDLILGMPHRGRLNVLANIFRKPYENIFSEFRDNRSGEVIGDGDVKYHKGFSVDVTTHFGHAIHLSLASNPSHLEAVDPVVEGKCRARQDRYGAGGDQLVLPVLLHGDAAFPGQGVVAETLNFSQVEGYRTGGTLHIILNNQIGFTTRPSDARTSCYATDPAKMISSPVFHVHGEDPEAVVHVSQLALEYRRKFRKDVFVEIICYRKYGHNEGDEPAFTQPRMYGRISGMTPTHESYALRLAEEGIDPEKLALQGESVIGRLREALENQPADIGDGFHGKWAHVGREWRPVAFDTRVPRDTLVQIAGRLAQLPEDVRPHPKVRALLEKRYEAVQTGTKIDWGTAETLAYATFVTEGTPVRLSGQDSRRGTFNHRHAVIVDTETERTHVPLQALGEQAALFQAYDSTLSEFGILGFEYGYSLESPDALTIWEAQFGDFVNGAQVIIDQFIVSGETKWERVSGLVMFLPHGYEGQGAEHSSARIERFLQLCAGNNIQVVYPTTPAQLFHLLRRQVRQPFRKPLVVFTPKSLLRHPLCVSAIGDFAEGRFLEVIADEEVRTPAVVLICAGKVYYDLLERRRRDNRSDVAIVRIEQLYPLREDLLGAALDPLKSAHTLRWVQEEPANMGAWSFIRPHLARLLGREPEYVGRQEDAAPAVGSHGLHQEQQERLVEEAFFL